MNRRDETRLDTTKRQLFGRSIMSLCLLGTSLLTGKPVQAAKDFKAYDTSAESSVIAKPQINLLAASGSTITFKANDERSTSILTVDPITIPHLVLYRNGDLTLAAERTLIITLNGLEIPAGGITVTLRLKTLHDDPDLVGGERKGITVWQEVSHIEDIARYSQQNAETTFKVEFEELSSSDQGIIPTPTDYYSVEVLVQDASNPAANPLFSARQEYAFLLESQWTATLNHFEAKNEIGPSELVVYYCDMFLFQRDARDATSRLPREEVADYVQTELIAGMADAIHLQTEVWGMSWDGWVSYRDSGTGETLGVALSDGKTWYHGPAPDRGNSSIAINANGGDNAEYETLSDGLMSTFHHELFHNFQRAISLANSGSGNVEGRDAAWLLIVEGMASFAATVAQPQIQYAQSGGARAYVAKAIQFVGGKGFPGELNLSYKNLNPYHGAMYWRYLYEQCGGMADSNEDPAKGLSIIRRTLEILYSKEIVDVNATTDLVRTIPLVMDYVLSTPEAAQCPFSTYADSLTHFARAIYTLRLEGGRCSAPGSPDSCGFYDPNKLYSEPKISVLEYTGKEILLAADNQAYPAGIQSSFGMDFVDLQLRPEVKGQSLTIELHLDAKGRAEFDVQVLKLNKLGSGGFSSQQLVQVARPENLEQQNQAGTLSMTIPTVDLDSYNRLGVIITRVDANEDLDSHGVYTLVIRPDNS